MLQRYKARERAKGKGTENKSTRQNRLDCRCCEKSAEGQANINLIEYNLDFKGKVDKWVTQNSAEENTIHPRILGRGVELRKRMNF